MTDGPRGEQRPPGSAILGILAVACAGFLAWQLTGSENRWTRPAHGETTNDVIQTTDDAFIAGDVTPLAAKVSGIIRAVPVKDFQPVKKGDVVAEIDPSDYDAALAQAQANVVSAKANLANLANQKASQRSLVRQAQAGMDAAQADLERFNLEEKRQRELLKTSDIGTTQRVEQAVNNARRSSAQMALSSAQLDQQKTVLASLDTAQGQLEALVRGAEAVATLAQNNVNSTRILSPANGIVGQRQVRPGQFVSVGSPVITVVSLPEIWVIANLKETQMTKVRSGQPARITVDAFPDLKVTGHVESWAPGTGKIFTSQAPDVATGNLTKAAQRVPVKIALDQNPAFGALVRPGMSVKAAIDTEGASNATAATYDPPATSTR
ncbi:HlyD family secretion protein [Hyphomicrobium sp.]|uniref:HlyD family secretion protein n=1 Tax=Hyphomicrobium sp. TaxID=82 RepID=UPI001E1A3D1B|nr:HlyD family secretion protein [Hyphomicrobium sp.]MBY0559736.1 HlyD family secretion protein [Hyphomicrobium sp.]